MDLQHHHSFDNTTVINMKLFLVTLCVAVASAARLENNYLPPSSAQHAGGSGSILSTPIRKASVSSYIPPASGPAGPSQQYGGPVARSGEAAAEILRFNNYNNGDGRYSFDFETQNHISHQETGELKNVGTDNEASSVHGSYSYTGADGVLYTVNYVADENGFRATGDHLPVAPPIPDAILKSIQQNEAEEAAGARNGHGHGGDDGQYQTPAGPAQIDRQYLAPKPNGANGGNSGYRY